MSQTQGEYYVGIDFNPSHNETVDHIKRTVADLIDFLHANGKDERCTTIACGELEQAAMWAVKSVTKRPRLVAGDPLDTSVADYKSEDAA